MKRLAGLSTLALIISATSGCGWLWGEDGYFRDRGSDYLSARQVAPMQVLVEGDIRPLEPLLPIPHQIADSTHTGEYEVPRPQRLQVAAQVSDFSIQSSEGSRWLVAQRAPAQVWAATRQFFVDNGFGIADERPQTGEFSTAWQRGDQLDQAVARNLGLQDAEARVRVRVEPGVQRNTSEVYVFSMKRPLGSNEEIAWPQTASTPELDRVLLDELHAKLASSAEQAGSVSLLAERDFDAPSRVTLSDDGAGIPVLQLETDFDRAWSSVGRALQAGDVRVDDLDRSLGVYYVNLAEGAKDPQEKPGFFGRLFGGEDKDEIDARAERYQLRLTRADDKVLVTLDKGIDAVAPADVARRVLSLIKDNLG